MLPARTCRKVDLLAGAVGSDDAETFAIVEGERDVGEDGSGAESFQAMESQVRRTGMIFIGRVRLLAGTGVSVFL